EARAMLLARDIGLVEDLDLDVRYLVDQRRIADERLAALLQLHQLGQLAEGPRGVCSSRGLVDGHWRLEVPRSAHRRTLRPRLRGGDRRRRGARLRRQAQRRERLERRARRLAEARLQSGEVARLAELATVLVDDANVHREVRRQLLGS